MNKIYRKLKRKQRPLSFEIGKTQFVRSSDTKKDSELTYVEGKEITKNQRKVKKQKAKKKESSNAFTKEATTTKSLHYQKLERKSQRLS